SIMNRKSLLRNSLLVTCLVISVIILSAQVNNNDNSRQEHQKSPTISTAPELTLDNSNAEGLEELDNIAARYAGNDLYLSGEILFYPDVDSVAMSPERAQFTSIITPLGSSYEIDSVQTIINSTIILLVDKREKSLRMIEQDAVSEESGNPQMISGALNEFREYISSVKVTNHGKDKKLVIMFKEESPANTSIYEIVYEPGTYRI